MSYAQLVAENRRIEILRALESDPDYEVNEHLLGRVLGMRGVAASADQVRGDLAWLEEQGLVAVRSVENLTLAKATVRGLDVATGRATVPGVARPLPEV